MKGVWGRITPREQANACFLEQKASLSMSGSVIQSTKRLAMGVGMRLYGNPG